MTGVGHLDAAARLAAHELPLRAAAAAALLLPDDRRRLGRPVALSVDDVEPVFARVAGTAMDVAVPAALVIVGPAVKVVVPEGASQTVLVASPVLRIGIDAVRWPTNVLAGRT